MRNVEVEKVRLVTALQENQKTHKADFDIAWEGFKKKALHNAEAIVNSLKSAKKGQELRLHVNLNPPVDHSDDYTRALEMLEWEQRKIVTLTEQEFSEFVQDDWGWKNQFSTSNMLYAGSASPSKVS